MTQAKMLLVAGLDLNSAYREMALDEQREAEALEWAEGTINDVADDMLESEAETEP
ncbi:MAG: hypothetical protein ACRYFS_02825 [Janthinobacterium lividum]